MKSLKYLFLLAAAAALLSACGSSRYHDPDLTAAFAIESTAKDGAAGGEATQADGEGGSSGEISGGSGNAAGESSADGEISSGNEGNTSVEEILSGDGDNSAANTSNSGISGSNSDPAEENSSSVDLLFSGDIYLSDHVLNAYDKAGGISGVLDEGFRTAISEADYFAGNQEFPFSSRGQAAPDKQYTFRLPESRLPIMNEISTDLVTLANNHTLDFGTDAMLDTISALDSAEILHVGAGANSEEARKPQIVDVGGIRVGFIGASRVIPVASWTAGASSPGLLTAYDPALLVQTIEETRPLCDYLVILIHWGVERAEMPVDHQTSLGRRCIDAGADLVVGSHPHVLQGIEYYSGKPIVYSLGNFIFGSSIPRTALLKLTLSEDGSEPQLSLLPGTSSAGYTRMLTDAAEKESFYQYMESISFDISIDENGVIHPAAPQSEDN